MGRWATYLIAREREDPAAAYARHGRTVRGWAWWELPLARGEAWDAGPGYAVVAHVVDSDVADVRGLVAGRLSWRWVFGEAILAEHEGRSVDGDALEDSLRQRATDTSRLIVQWSGGAGLPAVDGQGLTEILQREHTFAEEGVGEVLAALGIVSVDSATEYQDLDPTVDADGRPFGDAPPAETVPEPTPEPPAGPMPAGPTMAGTLAAPIDHSSDAWRGIVAEYWLDTFGEPPALVAIDGTVFVAFDPPIILSAYGRDAERSWVSEHLGVDWQEVPSEHAGEVRVSAAWARANVGVQGRPADEFRPRLNCEVPPDYLEGKQHGWWPYAIASPQHMGIELAMGTDLLARVDEVANWLDHARGLLLTPLAAAYAERVGPVHVEKSGPPGYALSLTQVCKSARGRYTVDGANDTAWRRALGRLRAGELTSVELRGGVANGFGLLRGVEPYGSLRIGAQLAADQNLYSLPAHLTVSISEPLRSLLPGPFVDDLITRAVEAMPVVGGWVDQGRILPMGDTPSRYESAVAFHGLRNPLVSVRGPAWRVLLGPDHLELLGGRAALEASGVFTEFREVGSLLMVQCGDQPVDCTPERRAATVDVLAAVLPPERDSGAGGGRR